MEEEMIGIISFPQMTLNGPDLEDYDEPRHVFEVEKCDDEGKITYSSYYPEADESFEGESIEKIAEQITAFLESDDVIDKVGEAVIKINIEAYPVSH